MKHMFYYGMHYMRGNNYHTRPNNHRIDKQHVE